MRAPGLRFWSIFSVVLILLVGLAVVIGWTSRHFLTGDIINIGGNIYVMVDGQRCHVPNPDTLDALGITRSWINNKGHSYSDLELIPQGPDIPDVNRDLSGFKAFKNAYFPKTIPIIPATATPSS